MKLFGREKLAGVLRILARLTLKKYHPGIIGVTGSVGKTGTNLYGIENSSKCAKNTREF